MYDNEKMPPFTEGCFLLLTFEAVDLGQGCDVHFDPFEDGYFYSAQSADNLTFG